MPIQQHLRPKGEIPDDKRTRGKDDAFEKMEKLRKEGRLHGRPLSEIGEEIGWSRQHVRNVMEDYYQTVDKEGEDIEEREEPTPVAFEGKTIEIPDGADPASYLKGYAACLAQE